MDPTRAAAGSGAVVLALAGCTESPDVPRVEQQPVTPIAKALLPPGMKWRRLSNRTFPPTEQRRARGAYLSEGLLQCYVCHSERDWPAPGELPVAGRKDAGLVWRADGKKRLVAPNRHRIP